MKKNKYIIPIIVIGIILIVVGLIIVLSLKNENKLTSAERTWIDENINNVQNVYITKDKNVFSKDGSGVFYSFINSLTEDYEIKLNPVLIDNEEEAEGVSLLLSKSINENEKEFFRDHYVILSKNKNEFFQKKDLVNKTIGVLNTDLDYVRSYLKDNNISFNGYESVDELISSLESTPYIILPRVEYINTILEKDLNIVYHLNDINKYFKLKTTDDVFGNIVKKYFANWSNKLNKEIKSEEFKVFKKSMGVTDTEVDRLLSVDYNYGFINNSPYEVIMNGKYGGIVGEYLQDFSEFSGVYFKVSKYNNINKLSNAISNNKVDVYFDYNYGITNDYLTTNNGLNINFSILTRKNSDKMFDSVYGLSGETIYVLENSKIKSYLESIGNINILTYKDNNELFKLNKKDEIIVMDTYIFDYYKNTKLKNYVSKCDTLINDYYVFKIKSEYQVLHKLLDKYINYLDYSNMILKGMNSHEEVMKNGSILNSFAKYIILTILGVGLVGFIIYKESKKIRVSKRIKKDDKIRFLDDLTMLKNRAYLKDFLKTWNNNSIYPQTIIVVGINKLQLINDKYGVEEGDKQIQAVANALIKTQLDNSDLMRSDGNEFVVYTVGYTEKQILNYLHKLTKEFKKLPYEYGAEFGFSIIENNLKTVEDALTEATKDMKNKKERSK